VKNLHENPLQRFQQARATALHGGIPVNHSQPAALSPHPGQGPDDETGIIERVALYAFLLNLGLAAMKGTLAFFSNSLAVTAGAIDSGADAVASVIVYGGLKLSTRKSASFPLGLYKIENLISLIVAFLIFLTGFEIAREVLRHAAAAPEISSPVVVLLGVGVAATYLFGRYAGAVGRRTASPTLIAESRHRQVDVLSSVVVLVSVLPGYLGWQFSLFGLTIDQIAAGVVLIFIARAGWELLVDGMRVLLDASIDFETLDQIRKILESQSMVVKVQSLTGRNAGRVRFLQASVVMRTDDLQKAHQTSESLERDIRARVPRIERVMIHYEPQPRTHTTIAIPLADPSGIISDHFGEAPYFLLATIRLADQQVEKKKAIPNPHREVEPAKGIRVAEWLVEQKVDHVFMREDLSHKGPGYVFGNAGVKAVITEAHYVEEVMAEFTAANP
jgi:cation diffusion facilitator family transporter